MTLGADVHSLARATADEAEPEMPPQIEEGRFTACDVKADRASLSFLKTLLSDPAAAQIVEDRIRTILAGWVAHATRSERSAVSTRTDTLLDCLTPAQLIAFLDPDLPAEGAALVTLALRTDRMQREAALDVLIGAPDFTSVRQQLNRTDAARLPGSSREPEMRLVPNRKRPRSAKASEIAFLERLKADDTEGAIIRLAEDGGLTAERVREAICLGDAKSLLAIAWRAHYSARTARMLQTFLAGGCPEHGAGRDAADALPVSRGELFWHLRAMATPQGRCDRP